ncbi:MAG: HD domain-containing protein [Anaerolineae bacterium]|nr:HD domain-containing protein [Anaerolineae bacterium]
MYTDEQVWQILDGLLVGADRRMDSVGDWAEHLDTEPLNLLVTRFVNQLDDEWYEADPPDAFCVALEGRVQKRLAASGAGWPHVWAHTLRVTGFALALADELHNRTRTANPDPVVVYALGLCHDVAKLDEDRTGEPHEELGARFAAQVLKDHLRPAQIAAIQAAITRESDDDLAHILADADKLDKIGAAGVVRRVSAVSDRGDLSDALWQVSHAARYFPAMYFDLSRELAARKRAFQAWFVPLAESIVDDIDDE